MKTILSRFVPGPISIAYWNYLTNLPDEQKMNVAFDIDHTLIEAINTTKGNKVDILAEYDFTISNGKYNVWLRPYYKILLSMAQIANLHIFTAANDIYANEVLLKMYHKDIFKTKWYRDDYKPTKKKNLLKITDDLSNIILVDDLLSNQYSNDQKFYHVQPFHNDMAYDSELLGFATYIAKLCIEREYNNFIEKFKK
jgi:hypothetical protein